MKKRVAVFFGGRSPEHDVSVVTGLQVLNAIDQERFTAFPVYVSTDGNWLVGSPLTDRANYLPREAMLKQLESVSLDVKPNVDGRGILVPREKKGMFSSPKPTEFDVALLAFHGLFGEDGRIQGLFEMANVPYTGMRPLASALCMDKVATKQVLAGTGIGLLPSVVISRGTTGTLPSRAEVEKAVGNISFPVIVKPVHLGSSIGVAKVNSIDELRATLPVIFRLDTDALVEPFVENLVEYNVAVRRLNAEILTSAIERPKSHSELLDFKAKYLSSGGTKGGSKQPGQASEGMLSLTRDINPQLPAEFESRIRDWAKACFARVNGSGAPRIDFLCNQKTGELWLNEVNPCPGSFGYFLWQAAQKPILFTDFLSSLIDEAFALHTTLQLPPDPTDPEARLFKR